MSGSARRTVAQWALLCLLVLGVIGMHHVNVGGDVPSGHAAMSIAAGSPGEQGPPAPPPAPAHDMLHMCMAILCAVALLLLGLLLLRVVRPADDGPSATSAWPRAPDRPPQLGGRELLSALCVLRL